MPNFFPFEACSCRCLVHPPHFRRQASRSLETKTLTRIVSLASDSHFGGFPELTSFTNWTRNLWPGDENKLVDVGGCGNKNKTRHLKWPDWLRIGRLGYLCTKALGKIISESATWATFWATLMSFGRLSAMKSCHSSKSRSFSSNVSF